MKKNISINISSIIFHIEEDGYEVLKNYLESINTYFSKFEDKKEIVNDIENRIAEIFLSKTSPSKQVITLEDVLSLISTMGTIADFAAIEEHVEVPQEPEYVNTEVIEDYTTQQDYSSQKEHRRQKRYSTHTESKEKQEYKADPEETTSRKLHRNTSRKVLGGVASGIADQFSVDPLWIRLLFIVAFITAATSGVKPLAGAIIITYIVLWIVLPVTDFVEESKRSKKLYRNPDYKVLGGVASGMAAYFGTDALVFRLLFLLSVFLGGTGIIVYIIFWIVTPEARSITDKIQMHGDPVTLTTIENNVKKNFEPIEDKEGPVTRLLLLPFRILAIVFDGILKILEPLFRFIIDAIRVALGTTLIVAGMAMLISLLMITGYLIGLYNGEDYFFTANFQVPFLDERIPPYATLVLFVVLFIPALAVILTGFSVIRNESSVNTSVAWSLFALWIIFVILAGATVPRLIAPYFRGHQYNSSEIFNAGEKTLFLTINDLGVKKNDPLLIDFLGHNGGELKLVKQFKARGTTNQEALDNSKKINLGVVKKDSVVSFDSKLQIENNEDFFIEEAFVNLYIPYNKNFVIDPALKAHLPYSITHKMNSDDSNNTFVFEEDGLKCIDCEVH